MTKPDDGKKETESLSGADLRAKVAAALEKDPSFMPQVLAAQLGAPLQSVIAALPEDMRAFTSGAFFTEIWEAMAEWERVTFMASTSGAILEIPCRLPKGKKAHGMYNLMDKSSPFMGHLLTDKVTSICFVSKQVFGLESHSVQFFDSEGGQCFAVYLGRDEKRAIIPSVREGFLALKRQYGGKEAAA